MMNQLLRPLARLLTVGMLGSGIALLSAGVAQAATCENAAPLIDSVQLTPNPIVVSSAYATTVTVTVQAEDVGGWDDCANDFNGGYDASGIGTVNVDLTGQSTPDYVSTTVTQIAGDEQSGTWQATAKVSKMESLGVWAADVTVADNDYNRTENQYAAYFNVKHATHITRLNAGPEPTHKWRTITVKGTFTELGSYEGYVGASGKIAYYFRRSGSTTWTYMGYSYSSASTGYFAKRFTAKRSGTWAAGFAGAGNYTRSNVPTDFVKVI
jgi:hypothetical protein